MSTNNIGSKDTDIRVKLGRYFNRFRGWGTARTAAACARLTLS
jgi:hypothetical protein